jgi:hypothetical protein
MYYQSNSLSEDQSPTSCTILDATKEYYLVEYSENGEFKTKEIPPDDLQKIDYMEAEISN